jgi:hypothetical protein
MLVPYNHEESNNDVILNLIIFYLNYNQHINLYKYKLF